MIKLDCMLFDFQFSGAGVPVSDFVPCITMNELSSYVIIEAKLKQFELYVILIIILISCSCYINFLLLLY